MLDSPSEGSNDMAQDADSAEEATSAAQRPRRPAPPASWTESRPTSSAPVEHCVGLSTPEGTLAAREEDIEAYVALGRQRSARRPGLGEAPGRGCEDVEAQLEGSPSCKSASDGDKKEVEVGEEDEWTYPDGGRRAWGVVFVSVSRRFFEMLEADNWLCALRQGVWCLSASQCVCLSAEPRQTSRAAGGGLGTRLWR